MLYQNLIGGFHTLGLAWIRRWKHGRHAGTSIVGWHLCIAWRENAGKAGHVLNHGNYISLRYQYHPLCQYPHEKSLHLKPFISHASDLEGRADSAGEAPSCSGLGPTCRHCTPGIDDIAVPPHELHRPLFFSSRPLSGSVFFTLRQSETLDAWYEIPHFAPTVVGIRTAMHTCRCCHTSHFSSVLIVDFLPALFTCTLFLQPLSRVDLDQQPFGTNIHCYPCPPAAAAPIGFFTGSARSTLYSWASRNRTLGLLRHSP